MAADMAQKQSLHALPDELLEHIVEYLDPHGLCAFGLTARWCYKLAAAVTWREVVLTDCRREHMNGTDEEGREFDGIDDHDDTPLLRKLLVLARNPSIASRVKTVIHRCHLPQPAIFNDLPRSTFSGMTLSPDPRTTKLIQLAVQQMTRVHTLRIIFGHPNITDALLRCFFSRQRARITPIRRLWLENCRISAGCDVRLINHPLDLPLELDFGGLESIRFRRLPMRPGRPTDKHTPQKLYVHSRGVSTSWLLGLQDGAGGHYYTATNTVLSEHDSAYLDDSSSPTLAVDANATTSHRLFYRAYEFDRQIYKDLAAAIDLPHDLNDTSLASIVDYIAFAYRGPWLDPADIDSEKDDAMWKVQRERTPSADVAIALLHSASASLTSICLDWVLTPPNYHSRRLYKWTTPHNPGWASWIKLYVDFFELRFPHLRALQFRNAVVKESMHPPGLYLLDHSHIHFTDVEGAKAVLGADYATGIDLVCLKFMEYHDNLQCLAWPMDGFFSNESMTTDVANRVQHVVNNLGRTLLDLRVDMLYRGQGEAQTDDEPTDTRERRRRFISHFAAGMTKVESIKIEGGIPRDERREIIRALHACPLKKIVMIGVCSALGNTWGPGGRLLEDRLPQFEVESLEGEDRDSIFAAGFQDPKSPPANFKFEPCYGKVLTPMMQTIAAFHPHTARELKFCGYKGSPVLFSPAPICQALLHSLKHFHNLDSLILSVWLSTMFEDAPRDMDIIGYWLDARSPNSTSLVRVVQDEEPEGWERELKMKFAPNALAWQIASFIGPFLSQKAKSRKGGVHVRASMCVGDWGGIFDIDLRIGKGSLNSDICLGFVGPREEQEPERRRSKLEDRRWF